MGWDGVAQQGEAAKLALNEAVRKSVSCRLQRKGLQMLEHAESLLKWRGLRCHGGFGGHPAGHVLPIIDDFK